MKTIPLWLDTDIGNDIDDAVALAYLLRQGRCDLVGISTVTGPVADRARIVSAVAVAAGRDDVPIYCGHGETLSGPGQPTCPQAEMLGGVEHREDFAADPQAALAALGTATRERPGELTLLAIGPLTNAARFFQADPELPKLLKRMVLMAGHFHPSHPPQPSHPSEPGAEWNALCDPEATRVVAAAAVERVWYGLDVTRKCFLPSDEVRRRFTGQLLETVYRFAEVWFRERERITFHDPLAAACVFEPGLCTYERGEVEVLTTGDHPGQTILAASDAPTADRIAATVDPQAFFNHYFDIAK